MEWFIQHTGPQGQQHTFVTLARSAADAQARAERIHGQAVVCVCLCLSRMSAPQRAAYQLRAGAAA